MADDGSGSEINSVLIGLVAVLFIAFCLIIIWVTSCRDRLDHHRQDLAIELIDGRDFALMRENLADTVLEEGKSEWQCIVCAHLNHPDKENCALCGASVEASKLNGTMLVAAGGSNNYNRSQSNMTLINSTLLATSSTTYLSLQSVESSTRTSLRSSIENLGRMDSNTVGVDGVNSVATSRQRALRYRRLNDLQLTQKQRGATRRRLWQRVPLPNGAFVWVRTTTQAQLQRKADHSFIAKLRDNTFLTKNPSANSLRDDLAEQLHRKNAASVGFFTELGENGEVSWRKTDSLAIQIDQERVAQQKLFENDEDEEMDLEALMALPFREKKKWFVRKVTQLAIPYTESLYKMEVTRENVLQDSMDMLCGPIEPEILVEHINIKFIGEPALDAGGVLREWFGLVWKELFSADLGLFIPTHAENLSYWINPNSGKHVQDHLRYFQFAGRLFGKAILEGLVFEANLALPLLKHFLGVPITFSDLEFLDEELHKSCVWMRDHDGVDSLCITFSLQTEEGEVVDLKPNGAEIDVTDENKMEYLALMLRYRMLGSVANQLSALLTGLYDVIPKPLLSVFDYQELDFFLCGLPVINVKDWQANTQVRHFAGDSNGEAWEKEIDVIFWFWETVEKFSAEDKARLLQFATGSTRVPVEGFKALMSASGYVHPFTLQLVPSGTPPLGMCPRAHTCFNRVDLPIYATKEELTTYLTLVIQMEITGFGFE